jgi:hypothetical protein
MINPTQIIKGKVNRVLNRNEDLSKDRLAICIECPVLNKKTFKCEKSEGGCGCYMKDKTRVKEAKCPKGKW